MPTCLLNLGPGDWNRCTCAFCLKGNTCRWPRRVSGASAAHRSMKQATTWQVPLLFPHECPAAFFKIAGDKLRFSSHPSHPPVCVCLQPSHKRCPEYLTVLLLRTCSGYQGRKGRAVERSHMLVSYLLRNRPSALLFMKQCSLFM